jgi:hypothetical protein
LYSGEKHWGRYVGKCFGIDSYSLLTSYFIDVCGSVNSSNDSKRRVKALEKQDFCHFISHAASSEVW